MMHVYLVLYKVALKKTPKQAVINTEIFKAHLARCDSRSKVSLGGTTLVEILKKGHWSHQPTWRWFFNKWCYSERSCISFNRGLENGLHSVKRFKVRRIQVRSKRLYEIKFSNYIWMRSTCNVIPVLWVKSEYDLILPFHIHPQVVLFILLILFSLIL